jgi:hypothetical protein
MEIYTQLYSTYSLNGKEILCDVYKWGLMTLSGSRLVDFQDDIAECTNFMLDSGKYSREDIYSSSAVDQNGNQVVIGERFIFDDTYFAHPKFLSWQNEFKNDPNIITYRPLVKET